MCSLWSGKALLVSALMDGNYAWPFWLAIMDGPYGWPLMENHHGWPFWDGFYGWLLWMAFIDGPYGWPYGWLL